MINKKTLNKSNNVKKLTTLTKRIYPKRSFRDIKNFNLLKKLNGDYLNKLNVTFLLLDGTKKILPINNEFFINKNDKKLSESEIIEKLNTLKHDFLAEEYRINKL